MDSCIRMKAKSIQSKNNDRCLSLQSFAPFACRQWPTGSLLNRERPRSTLVPQCARIRGWLPMPRSSNESVLTRILPLRRPAYFLEYSWAARKAVSKETTSQCFQRERALPPFIHMILRSVYCTSLIGPSTVGFGGILPAHIDPR